MAIEEWERDIQKALGKAIENEDTLEIIRKLKEYIIRENKEEHSYFILSEESIAGLIKKLVTIIINCDHLSTAQAYKTALEFISILRNTKDRTMAVKIVVDSLDSIGEKTSQIHILEMILQTVWDDTNALCYIGRDWEKREKEYGKKILEKRYRILQKHPCQYHVAHEMAVIAGELFLMDEEEGVLAFEKSIEAAKEIDYYIDSHSIDDNTYREMQKEKSVIFGNIAQEIAQLNNDEIKRELFHFALQASIDPFANDPDGYCQLPIIAILFQHFHFDPQKTIFLFKELGVTHLDILCAIFEGLTHLNVNRYYNELANYYFNLSHRYLESSGEKDELLSVIAKVMGKIHPEAGVEFASSIINPRTRAVTIASVALEASHRMLANVSRYFEIPLFIAVNDIKNFEEKCNTLKEIAAVYSQLDILSVIVFSDMYGLLKSDTELGIFYSEMIRNVKSAPDYLFIKEELANHLFLTGVAKTGLVKVAEFEINIENYREILDELGVIQTS